MKNLENIYNVILITNDSTRKAILRDLNKVSFIDTKILTDKEFYKRIYFQIDTEAITKIMELHPEVSFYEAKKIYESLPYLIKKIDKNDKLYQYFDELNKLNYIHKDIYFNDLLKSKPLYIDECVLCDSLKNYLCENKISYNVIDLSSIELNEKQYLEFNDASEELHYVLNEVCKLIETGFDVNKIYLYGLSDSYRYPISYFETFFNIDIDLPYSKPILLDDFGKETLQLLQIYDVETAFEEMQKKYKEDVLALKNVYFIFQTLIKYQNHNLDSKVQMEVFRAVLKDISLTQLHLKNAVKVTNEIVLDPNAKVFVMNFNQDMYPKSLQNTMYLNNKSLKELGVETFEEKNRKNKIEILNFLSGDNIALITRKKHGSDGANYLPSIVNEFNMVLKNHEFQNIQYAKDYLPIILANYEDKYRKFRYRDPNFYTLKDSVEDNYLMYDKSFSYIPYSDEERADVYLNATSIDTYFSCPFKYYVEMILLNDVKNESTFVKELGSFVHKILEKSYESNFDYDTLFEFMMMACDFDVTSKTLLIRLKEDIKNLINYIRKNEALMAKNFSTEREKWFELEIIPNTFIRGSIDKVYKFNVDGNDYVSVVDYKSSETKFDYRKLQYGRCLQLPTYMLALRELEEYSNAKLLGIFYQTILAKQSDYIVPNDDLDSKYYENYRLNGVMLNNIEALRMLDLTLSGKYVKNLKLNSKNELASTRTPCFFTEEQFDLIIDIARKKYDEAAEAIRNSIFDIAPVQIGNDASPCRYCKQKDICYASSLDVRHVKLDQDDEEGE